MFDCAPLSFYISTESTMHPFRVISLSLSLALKQPCSSSCSTCCPLSLSCSAFLKRRLASLMLANSLTNKFNRRKNKKCWLFVSIRGYFHSLNYNANCFSGTTSSPSGCMIVSMPKSSCPWRTTSLEWLCRLTSLHLWRRRKETMCHPKNWR